MVRLYQLKDAQTFAKLENVRLRNNDLELLKADLLDTKDVILKAGAAASVGEPMDEQAEYVGVVAFFRSPNSNDVWKLLIPKMQWKDRVAHSYREPGIDASTPPPSLQALHDLAARLNWRCLSPEWKGKTAKYAFECQHGHRLERSGQVLRATPTCAQCEVEAIRARLPGNVASYDGEMLDSFKGLQERHRLRCARGQQSSLCNFASSASSLSSDR